jgi:hypothetical protein
MRWAVLLAFLIAIDRLTACRKGRRIPWEYVKKVEPAGSRSA